MVPTWQTADGSVRLYLGDCLDVLPTKETISMSAEIEVSEPRIRTIYEFGQGRNASTVEFVPVANVPGFSHRVAINGVSFDWLSSDFRPSKNSAKYFYAQYIAK